MFDDIKRFETGSPQQLDWFRQLLDGFLPDGNAADIRAVPRGSFPMINVARSDDTVRVYVFAAGLAPSDLTIDVQDNVLTLRGKREPVMGSNDDGSTPPVFRRERVSGEFVRAIALPDGLDAERAEARHNHGVFEIVLPKREELKPRRIDVQVA
ncbi:Hsp20/alpha crystallin family protein [Halomonas sp. QHL1]|uniref:Hsp20/alpha crystallin family protein n=1 Tax=Halomonas sp. QHL1 TaxID=1123773 RepID=UPI0008FCF968|nr:Hsp20/alpha crystallin family protein [Halomonas sp. QHL1]OJA05746.1 heat-shock protein Hsp20 [Halomonas sp. QHL1]